MMSVLEIATAALDEIGLPVPTSIISTTDDQQRQVKALILSAARYLRNQRIFPQQKKGTTVTLEAARNKYPLPSDYYAALPGTQWDDDRQWRLLGPLSDRGFTNRTKGLAGTSLRYGYRIFGPDFNPASTGGQFMIDPTPTDAGEVLSYEYITRYMFCKSDYTTYSETIVLDADLCFFDDDLMVAELRWRYLRAKKKDYAQELSDAKAMLETATQRFQGSFIGSMVQDDEGPSYYVPDGSWSL